MICQAEEAHRIAAAAQADNEDLECRLAAQRLTSRVFANVAAAELRETTAQVGHAAWRPVAQCWFWCFRMARPSWGTTLVYQRLDLRVGSGLRQVEALQAAAAAAPAQQPRTSRAGRLVRYALFAARWLMPWALPCLMVRQVLPRRQA